MTDVRLQVALLCSTNDMKAEKQFTPFLDSGADCFCSLCNYDKKRPGAGKAFSFLRQSRSCIQKPGWKLRSQAVLDRQLETASRLKESKQDFVAYCQRHGLRYTNFNVRRLRPATPTATRHDTCLLHPQLHVMIHARYPPLWQTAYPLHRDYMPGFNLFTQKPSDAMHLEDDGVMDYHTYWTLNIGIKFRPQWKEFTLENVQRRINECWVGGSPPIVGARVEKTEKAPAGHGAKFRPKRGGSMKWNASQVRAPIHAPIHARSDTRFRHHTHAPMAGTHLRPRQVLAAHP